MAETPEAVAFALMEKIAMTEGRTFNSAQGNPVNREWILRTYHQCRQAVTGTVGVDSIVDKYKP